MSSSVNVSDLGVPLNSTLIASRGNASPPFFRMFLQRNFREWAKL